MLALVALVVVVCPCTWVGGPFSLALALCLGVDVVWKTETQSAPWKARDSAAVTHVGGFGSAFILLTGGVGTTETPAPLLNDVWMSTTGRHWDQLPDAPWPGRYGHCMLVANGRDVLVFGGYDGNQTLTDAWVSTDGGSTFVEKGPVGWAPLALLTASVSHPSGFTYISADATRLSDGTVVAVLGMTPLRSGEVWFTQDSGGTWHKSAASVPWYERYDHQVVAFGDTLFMAGGIYYKTSHRLGDVWRDEGNLGASWVVASPAAQFGALSSLALLALDSSLLVLGGYDYDGELSSRVWVNVTRDALDVPAASVAKVDHQSVHWEEVTGVSGASVAPLATFGVTQDSSTQEVLIVGGTAGSVVVWRGSRPALWADRDCAKRHAVLCQAAPHSETVEVTVSSTSALWPGDHTVDVSTTSPFHPAGEVPTASSYTSAVVPTLSPRTAVVIDALIVDISWPFPVLGLAAGDFVVDTGPAAEMGRYLTPTGGDDASGSELWTLEVDVEWREGSVCPPGYTSSGVVSISAGVQDVICGREVGGAMTWEQASAACAPFHLATVDTEAALSFFSSLRTVSSMHYWSVDGVWL